MPNVILAGIDLVDGDPGPLRFASWWGERVGLPAVAAHVIPAAVTSFFADSTVYGDYEEQTRAALERIAAQVQPSPETTEIVADTSAEHGLVAACDRFEAALLVLGRRAIHTGPSWLRLGPVARHLVQRLPRPTVIVPHGWAPPPPARNGGPVVAMVQPDASSEVALATAIRHAEALDRELVVAHAALDPARELATYIPQPALEELQATRRQRDRAALDEWLDARRLPPKARVILELGSARSLGASLVDRLQPSLVVVGSRRLSVRDRWFGSSTSTDLAAHLDTPVLIAAGEAAA